METPKEVLSGEENSSSVENIKQELAEMYVDFLDQQKEGVISL